MIVLKKWLGYGFLSVLCVFLLVLSLAPPVLRGQVTGWLAEQGVEAEFQHLSVSLGRGRLELGGVVGRDQQGRGFALDKLVVDVALWPLLDQQVIIESVKLDGLRLDVTRTPADIIVGGLSLGALSAVDPATPSTADVEVEESAALAADWSMELQALSLTQIELCAFKESATSALLAHHCFELGELALEGGLMVRSVIDLTAEMPGQLKLLDIQLQDRLQGLDVFSVTGLFLSSLTFVPDQVTVHEFSLQGMALLERRAQLSTADTLRYHGGLGQLTVRDISWQPEALRVDEVALAGLDLLMHRDEKAALPVIRLLDLLLAQADDDTPGAPAVSTDATHAEKPSPKKTAGAVATGVKSEPMSLQLARFSIGGDSIIRIIDQGVQPALQQSLSRLQLDVSNMDSAKVEQGSELSLQGVLGEFGQLELAGDIWPFKSSLNLNLEGQIGGMDLLPFTGYLEGAIGYQVQTGQLNQRLKLSIKDDILDAKAELELDKFHLQALKAAIEDGAAEEAAETDVETTLLPIGVALNLLRDTDDKIFLVLPVKGHIDDPSLSVAHVLGIVTRKAMTAAVLNYYAPFGLLDLATMLAKSATALRFEPLEYSAGQSALNKSHRERMAKFSQLLADKPQLSMSFCASASGADALHLLGVAQEPEAGVVLSTLQRESLRVLARQRTSTIKASLLEQGAKPSQVVVCQPSLALQRFDDAQVDVSL